MRSSLLFSLLLGLAFPASASEPAPRGELREAGALPPWMRGADDAETAGSRRFPLGLTFGFAGALRFEGDGGTGNVSLWAGVRYPRFHEKSTVWGALGTELAFLDHEIKSLNPDDKVLREAYTEVVPEARFGFSSIDRSMYEKTGQPVFLVYGLVGRRIPNRHDPTVTRVGVGISSGVPLLCLGALDAPIALPTTIELVLDLDPSRTEPSIRFGFVF